MATIKTNVRTIINAVRVDGYEQAFGAFVKNGPDGKPYAACALGQAALNLKVEPSRLSVALGQIRNVSGESLSDQIIGFNDENKWPLDKIADRIERDWADHLDESVTIA